MCSYLFLIFYNLFRKKNLKTQKLTGVQRGMLKVALLEIGFQSLCKKGNHLGDGPHMKRDPKTCQLQCNFHSLPPVSRMWSSTAILFDRNPKILLFELSLIFLRDPTRFDTDWNTRCSSVSINQENVRQEKSVN